MGAGYGPGWRGRARRGDVRTAILTLLAEQSMHGYQIIQELEQRSQGIWRPSAGSIYPTLLLLTDEGLLSAEDQGGRRVYSVTETGRKHLETNQQQESRSPWRQFERRDDGDTIREAAFRLMGAVRQVDVAASEDQRQRALALIEGLRRELYGLLAEGAESNESTSSEPSESA